MPVAASLVGKSDSAAEDSSRLAFIDNLRWVMIVLVVSRHAAVTYSHLGSWYVMEDPKPGRGVLVLFAAYQMFLQAFFMGLLFLMGTSILNMQLCFFSQYILLFSVGILARRRDWLVRISYPFGVRWLNLALTAGSLAWLGIILAVLLTGSEARLSGGWTWQSAAVSVWESFFCVGVCLGLMVIFRDKFNRMGGLARWLSDNAFCVYVVHPPLLIAVTLALRNLAVPKPVKFLCATLLGALVAYLASSLVLRRIPVLKRVL